jgi:hypothetical protein
LGREQHVELTVLVGGQGGVEPSEGIETVGGHVAQAAYMARKPAQAEAVRRERFHDVTAR